MYQLAKTSKIQKVAATIIQKDGKILLAKRKTTDTLGGLWEFPGGKIEEGETAEECLVRELKEELSIDIKVGEFFRSNIHTYPFGTVQLFVYHAIHKRGEFVLNNHDRIQWVNIDKISDFDFPPANIPIIADLKNIAAFDKK